jgi:Uma2 family endonuclease
MNEPYEEIVNGESVLRFAPGARHELICRRLHAAIQSVVFDGAPSRCLAMRTTVKLSVGSFVRPDLVLVTAATGKPWLIAEVVDTDDHSTDTVAKKSLYEEMRIPRLWMIDSRYDNVETYQGTPYGLVLKRMLAGKECLVEALLPALNLPVCELFKPDIS